MTRSKWKIPYINFNLLNKINKLNKKNKPIHTKSRNSIILKKFIGLKFKVYNGKQYRSVYVTNDMVGHKFGEFSFTRKVGKIHK